MRWTAEITGAPTNLEKDLAGELQAVARKYGADAFSFVGRIGKIDLGADLSKVANVMGDVETVAKDAPIPGASEVATVAGDVAALADKAAEEAPKVEAEAQAVVTAAPAEVAAVAATVEADTAAAAAPVAEAATEAESFGEKVEGAFHDAEAKVEDLLHHGDTAQS